MEVPEGVLSPEAMARLADVTERKLTVAQLDVGAWGVLDVVVDHLVPPRTFRRKNGSEGTVQRAVLSDATGTIEMVLWDGEGELTKGPLAPGQRVRIRGATVKAGWRGGLELGLGSAVLEPFDDDLVRLEGTIVSISDTDIVDGRFRADVVLRTDSDVSVVVWDDTVKQARDAGIGGHFVVDAAPHPALDGWYIA